MISQCIAETKMEEAVFFFTIPYTGTWGVVIGKATGAGAFAEIEEDFA